MKKIRRKDFKPLEEQVIVITGASSGIGLATAREASKSGAKLVLVSRNEDALKQLVQELKEDGGNATYVAADVARKEDVARVAQNAVCAYGQIDTWINNAGVSIFGKLIDVNTKDMQQMFQTTYWGSVYGSLAAVKHFREKGKQGKIINIGSLFGDRGTVLQSSYASAKAALHSFTNNLRMELEKDKLPIDITLIHPGRIDTPFSQHAKSYLEHQPAHIGMTYTPDVMAEAILYAATHAKRDLYVGGQAKLIEKLGQMFPRFTDKYMELTMFRTQQDKKQPNKDTDALYEPGYALEERGNSKGISRSKSYYLHAEQKPLIMSVAVLTAFAGLKLIERGVKRKASKES